MKKIFLLIAMLFSVLNLAACNSNSTESEDTNNSIIEAYKDKSYDCFVFLGVINDSDTFYLRLNNDGTIEGYSKSLMSWSMIRQKINIKVYGEDNYYILDKANNLIAEDENSIYKVKCLFYVTTVYKINNNKN